ncbi:carboxypeptidase regulatory-like domain-containing protein [Ideonella sp. A 288]|uniref:TonB-dependent receptor n=1 Tax=Ideonella sp. A 288 TaxID=1962181 RepID=UPI000B4B1404|nr:carboxypeptidase regulatory-like domain-containing protein [Ideonella sp. A 288]
MNSDRFSVFARTALSAAVAIVAAAPVLAQNTTAGIAGRVTSANGAPVAGASVSILHVESRSVSTATTDADGRYSARGLRVGGPYTITISKAGQTDQREGVFLALAETLALDATLGAPTTTVVVTGQAGGLNTGAVGAGTALGSRELNAYASIRRSLQDYARIDPRVAQTDKETGSISALGQNIRFNSITIDGVTVNDTFGLEGNNLPTLKQPVSMDAIQSVQVNLANFDVTQKGYTGANINAVTKSGTNDFKGSVYFVHRDEDLAGQRYNRTTRAYADPAAFKEQLKGATLGGPIIKDKLFFFASYEELASSRTTPSFGPVGSSLTNVRITPAQIAAIQNVAKTTYGIDLGSIDVPSGTELTVKDTLIKLDWNISDRHRANVRWTKTEQTDPKFNDINQDALSLSSYYFNEIKTIDMLVGQWFADWSDTFSTEFKVSKRDFESAPTAFSNLPRMNFVFPADATASRDRTLNTGTENNRHFNALRTNTLDAYVAGTLTLGQHEVKLGADWQDNDIFNAFLTNTKGFYTFRGADPAALFAAGTPTGYQVQLPLAGRTIDDGAANWTLQNLGVFLQDTWAVAPNLSVQLGVRVDKTGVPDSPIRNAAASSFFGFDNTYTIDGETLVQPRLGFNYKLDLGEKRKGQLRGGVGLFQGAAATVWLSNPFSNTGVATANFTCNNTGGTPCPAGLRFSADPANQPAITGQPPAAAVDFIAPGVQQPSVWKFNLAADAELPPLLGIGGLVAGAEWVHTETKQGLFYRNLNLGKSTATGIDGRQLYYNAAALNAATCWTDGGTALRAGCGGQNRANRNTAFGNVLLTDSTSHGAGDAITLSLSKPARSGFGWQMAYTRTRANEVSPLTSSIANSNWQNMAVFNANEEFASNSNYLIRDRVSAAVNWSKAFIGNYRTTVGLFYEGRSGRPYSWIFNNDANGDGVISNDLLYIPKAPGSGEVIFRAPNADRLTAAQAEAKFWSIVEAHPALNGARGQAVGRNTAFAKFVNTFDMRLSQELPGFLPQHRGVLTFDILNVGNLLNKRWGRIDEVPFPSVRRFVNFAGLQDGKYVYSVNNPEDVTTRQNAGESQWAIQVTAKYEF